MLNVELGIRPYVNRQFRLQSEARTTPAKSTFNIQHSTLKYNIQHYLKGPDRYQSGSTCR